MNHMLKRETLSEGVSFSSVTDPKFKHNRITVNLVVLLEKETVTENALVPFLLRKGCRSCPDFTQLNRKLCNLYGASLSCDVSKYGGYQSLELTIQGIDDRFTLNGEPMAEECARLLVQILFEPKMENGLFSWEEVELEKQQVIDAIESLLNEKRAYAMSRCRSIVCEGEPMAIEKYGDIACAKALTPQKATHAYERMLRRAQIEILFTGCGDPEKAKAIFVEAFKDKKREPITVTEIPSKAKAGEVREVTEELDVSQSKLVLGFRAGTINEEAKLMAMSLMAGLYGGTPNSKLFLNVREKLSLCYYCAARFDRMSRLMFVDCGVERENKEKAQEEILRQLDEIRNGFFTDEEVTAARLLMQTSRKAVGDSLGALENWYMSQIMNHSNRTPSQESALLEQVAREQIIEAARQLTLDTVYFLTGKEAR